MGVHGLQIGGTEVPHDANRTVFGERGMSHPPTPSGKQSSPLLRMAAIAEFRQDSDDVRIDADVNDVRLISIEFDSKTQRVVAEAGGNVHVAVKLSGL